MKLDEIVSHAVETLLVVRLGTCLQFFHTLTFGSHMHTTHSPPQPPPHPLPPPTIAVPVTAAANDLSPVPVQLQPLAGQDAWCLWAQFSFHNMHSLTTTFTSSPLSSTCPASASPCTSFLPPSVSPLCVCLCHPQHSNLMTKQKSEIEQRCMKLHKDTAQPSALHFQCHCCRCHFSRH